VIGVRPRGVRSRLWLTIVLVVAVALAVLTAAFNVVIGRILAGEANKVLRARAAAELPELARDGNRLKVLEPQGSRLPEARVWIVSRGRILDGPARSAEARSAVIRLAARAPGFAEIPHEDTRLYARPVVIDGRRLGAVVSATLLGPYEETRRTALLGSIAFAAVVLVAVALAGLWLLSSALRPVAEMTDQAAAWSEHDSGGRFAPGEPYDELTRLAATLDQLLDRLAASLRREQRFSAELSHELRTPLAAIVAEAELALRRDRTPAEYRTVIELVLRDAARLRRAVDTVVAAAQQDAGIPRGTSDAFDAARRAADGCARLAADHGVELEVDRPEVPVRVGVGADLVVRILHPILENACQYGTGRVRISVARDGARVAYAIDDDGPGIRAAEREQIFEPGVRGEQGRRNGAEPGAGLGLALAVRLAGSVEGEVEADTDGDGGRFVVRLPAG